MWDNKLFSELVGECANKKIKIGDIRCLKKWDVYERLGEMVDLSGYAVEKWSRDGSRGPSSNDACAKLENFFGIPLFKDGENVEKKY